MKILIVADWHGEIYAQSFYNGFKRLGFDTYKFSWKEYFKHYQYPGRYQTDNNKLKSLYYRFQNKFLIGPILFKINRDLIKKSEEVQPDLVFIYRGTHIYPSTIKKIKQSLECRVFGYNNDDSFSNEYKSYVWRHYKQSIPYYDWIFSYRWKNINNYKDMGYDKVSLLGPYYLKKSNFYIENLKNNRYRCDVIFIGHFEDDGRDEAIKILVEHNIDIKLYGTGWENSRHHDYLSAKLGGIMPLYKDYNLALNSAKISLVFLSKLNNDTYTRRCFEIPATKSMMMAEYTPDLNSMFKEGVEAEYFRGKKELLMKIKFYLENNKKLQDISENGYKALANGEHEVKNRCKEIVRIYDAI
jgi:spore maturation protein CgeB